MPTAEEPDSERQPQRQIVNNVLIQRISVSMRNSSCGSTRTESFQNSVAIRVGANTERYSTKPLWLAVARYSNGSRNETTTHGEAWPRGDAQKQLQ